MKLIKKILYLCLFASISISCSKNDDEIKPIQTDVYVTGVSNNKATLWKNGIATLLHNSYSVARCMFISEDDVYVGGFVLSSTVGAIPTIWKNGIQITLPIPDTFFAFSEPFETYEPGVTSIFVSGNDVYAVGTLVQAGSQYGMIWKNGVLLPLLVQSREARSIILQGTDVYVAGSKNGLATIWKNGNPTNLTDVNLSTANAITINGNDVYVCGTEYVDSFARPRLWKNGEIVSLSNPTTIGQAKSVFVSGNDVYVVGYKFEESNEIAVLWKNGVESTINGTINNKSTLKSVFAIDNDVYIAGTENFGSHGSGAFWTNGNSTLLSYGTNSQCNSIFVTKK